jgi:hypothetical protein
LKKLRLLFAVYLLTGWLFISPAYAEETPAPEPSVTVIVTNGGDDVSYQVPLTTTVIFDDVTYSNVYATTNSVITFGNPDGTYWTYPSTPSVSIESRDWWALPQQMPDTHFIISVSDGGFQVDGAYRPFGTMTGEVTNIVITAQITTSGQVEYTYSVQGPLYGGERTGARLTDGSIVPLEQIGITEVAAPVELAPEPVAPTPVEPSPEPPAPVVPEENVTPITPQPTPNPQPIIVIDINPEPLPMTPEQEPELPTEDIGDGEESLNDGEQEPVETPELPTQEPEQESPLEEPIDTPIDNLDEPTSETEENQEPLTAESLEEAGISYDDLPPDTPVEVRQDANGNPVVITAEVAAALVVLESPVELLTTIFNDPTKALLALSSIGADMTEEEREESEKAIVAAVIVGGIAVQSATSAAIAGTVSYRRRV